MQGNIRIFRGNFLEKIVSPRNSEENSAENNFQQKNVLKIGLRLSEVLPIKRLFNFVQTFANEKSSPHFGAIFF
jgi:hypothetical protein